ncbi:hypothetical protein PG999_001753 [Apiospora kogelbergensis]|uniref:Uncharacterized protein n=1 Tax=Apiospora kogelbergensis TaxID=1337665 RepID=A0AAW0R6F9_9PEZI
MADPHDIDYDMSDVELSDGSSSDGEQPAAQQLEDQRIRDYVGPNHAKTGRDKEVADLVARGAVEYADELIADAPPSFGAPSTDYQMFKWVKDLQNLRELHLKSDIKTIPTGRELKVFLVITAKAIAEKAKEGKASYWTLQGSIGYIKKWCRSQFPPFREFEDFDDAALSMFGLSNTPIL